jgi:ATP phosphoribosyltransferase-like protein
MLKLVIPKGSLEEQTLRLFEAADLTVRRSSSRDYHGSVDDDRIERVSVLRPQEIPTYVAEGLFDLGITGQDWIAETGSDVEVLTSLSYAKTGTGHGMKIIETLLTSDPVLVANRAAAADPQKRAAMDDITTLLLGALAAEGRVLIKLNVTEAARDAVLAVVPSMKAPTVSPLADGGYAIETVVDKRGVNRLIPELKAAGATDILELPISKIVP